MPASASESISVCVFVCAIGKSRVSLCVHRALDHTVIIEDRTHQRHRRTSGTNVTISIGQVVIVTGTLTLPQAAITIIQIDPNSGEAPLTVIGAITVGGNLTLVLSAAVSDGTVRTTSSAYHRVAARARVYVLCAVCTCVVCKCV